MNHTIDKLLYCLSTFLFITAALSGCGKIDPQPAAAQTPVKTPPNSLHVPFIAQIGDEWCWAACTEMVSKYYHQKIDPHAPVIGQCELVNMVSGADKIKCPAKVGEIPIDFDQPGTPFPTLGDTNCKGYHTVSTFNPNSSSAPLSAEQLMSQIASGLPVIFEWNWGGMTIDSSNQNGSHFMVAEGIPHSSYITSHIWISVHDPLPAGRGRHRIISYAEYANDKPMTLPGVPPEFIFCSHASDYYQLTYKK